MKSTQGPRNTTSAVPGSLSGGKPGASAPARDTSRLIPVDASRAAGLKMSKVTDLDKFWRDYYETREESADDLRKKIGTLNGLKKFRDVKAILFGFLKSHPAQSEAWMYEALALAIKLNGGDESEIKQSLDYAADLALATKNPNPIVSVADQLLLLGYNDRTGELLDTAMDMVPHRGEPILMSIKLAKKLNDPKRMGDSVEKLLSLGWPNMDDSVRRDARKQVEALAKVLKEEGRDDEATTLLDRLPLSEARDLFIRATWIGDADIDIIVDEPLGATACYKTPRTVFGGAIVKNGYGIHPEEVYVCPRAFDGEYTVKLDTVFNNPAKPALSVKLEIVEHEGFGTPKEHKEVKTIKLGKDSMAEPIKITLKGGRRTSVLPFVDPNAVSATIQQEVIKTRKGKDQSAKEPAAPKSPRTSVKPTDVPNAKR